MPPYKQREDHRHSSIERMGPVIMGPERAYVTVVPETCTLEVMSSYLGWVMDYCH